MLEGRNKFIDWYFSDHLRKSYVTCPIPNGDTEYGKVEYKVLPGDVDVILHDVTNNLHC